MRRARLFYHAFKVSLDSLRPLPLAGASCLCAQLLDGGLAYRFGELVSESFDILVVDDNVDAAEMLGELLKLRGHHVRICHDGPAAIRMIDEAPANVAFVDIGMPGMDGYELARRLRAEHPKIHLIAITGYGQPSDVERSHEAGFDRHLVKPVSLASIDQVLVELAA